MANNAKLSLNGLEKSAARTQSMNWSPTDPTPTQSVPTIVVPTEILLPPGTARRLQEENASLEHRFAVEVPLRTSSKVGSWLLPGEDPMNGNSGMCFKDSELMLDWHRGFIRISLTKLTIGVCERDPFGGLI